MVKDRIDRPIHGRDFKPSRLIRKREAILVTNADFAETRKKLEDVFFPGVVLVVLYEAGKAYGETSAKRLRGRLGMSVEDMLQAIVDTKRAEGWGTITFKDLTVKGKPHGRIIVKDSFEAKGYGKSTIPVCNFLRGYLAGALSAILTPKARTQKIELVETKCIAKGDKHCEFQTVKEVAQRD